MIHRPRFVHKFVAWLMGYFWLPCPLCGENFAGYEDGDYILPDPYEPGRGSMTCWKHPEDNPVAETIAGIWDRAYTAGVNDEETSQAWTNGQISPARINPYSV